MVARLRAEIATEAGTPVKVFVPHTPPLNTKVDKIFLGRHVGSTSVREFIEREQPDVVICGHIHEARGQDTIGRSKIVNCGSTSRGYFVVVEIGEEIKISNEG
ncbi:MAG: metallophosphoesterase [Bacteroidota bacterium]